MKRQRTRYDQLRERYSDHKNSSLPTEVILLKNGCMKRQPQYLILSRKIGY